MTDWLALLISFIYVFGIIGLAEGLRSWRGYSPDFTRKVVHVGVGMWAVGTVLLFENRWMALIPPVSFVVLNYISYRLETFKAMESENKSNLGTVYFPLAFCVVIIWFWPRPDLIVAALMPLTWGDAMASVLGQRYGHLHYRIFNHSRTVEGSVSMFVFSFISTLLALWILPLPTGFLLSVGLALLIAILATLTEAVSPWGLDNLSVPAVSSLILWLWF